jgi:glycosyltransferase involved in cell wall biosynthesis
VRHLVFALPGDPETRTGGYIYDKRLVAGLRALGWQVELLILPEVLGRPQTVAPAIAEAARRLTAAPPGVPVMVDGLALGALPEAAAAVAARGPLIALVHHPLAEETGLSAAAASALRASERAALRHAAAAVVTSPATARGLAADYGMPPERIVVAVPGVDPAPLAEGTGTPFALLSVGSLTPRKGHRMLLQALDAIECTTWHLTIVGSPRRDRQEAEALQTLAAESRHSRRIAFAGEAEASKLTHLFRAADLFVLPSFHEGYGMVLTESLAHGVPVVATTAGAIPETVPKGAGRLVPPGDARALAAVLAELMRAPAAYAELRAGARAARERLPRWRDTAATVAAALERLA